MAFYSTAPEIQAGDTIIVYSSRTQLNPLVVTPGTQLQSRYGHFKHDDMVGVPYGSKFASSNGRGFVYLLKPTPELWTLALPHRTQILYLPDIAFITSYLDVKAGSKVIEAGTGSGSFSHSIARSVGKTGKIHSFEFHEERFTKAQIEFKDHGLDDVITLKHQNVYKDGFELKDEVDSVFLDLPAPWEAIGHAKEALRKDRQSRICCFSPCIEQVLRTVTALSELGFSDITMYEALTRDHEPATTLLPDVSAAIERIQGHEAKKERRRESQIAEAQRKREEKERKRKHDEESGAVDGAEEGEEGSKSKKARVEESEGVTEEDVTMEEGASTTAASTPAPEESTSAIANPPPLPTVATPSSSNNNGKGNNSNNKKQPYVNPNHHAPKHMTFRAGAQTRGHTSYLTFATLLPKEGGSTEDSAVAEKVVEAVASAAESGKEGQAATGPSAEVLAEDEEFPMTEGDEAALLAVDMTELVGK
ncbi:tRNA methyltransferase complex GCD14 subunit-domain-containing protein [Leucosporidium creatinivorum]|uniref:tRNA (adenine(58)-N(1))-methyltransferase catalytic subunit TRM61 n=1 Tax=Leucosporidium creatinivorum TaxID=106004 RepID=A0A1Y2FJC4_9BASI|nr:tRNA methyltransferase complex GCD14 subunit-domain-containing protein [Leucosporidium creatinivorum]